VKVRLQAEGKLPPGVPRRYSGALNAYSTIVKQVVHQTFEIRNESHLVFFQLIILFYCPNLFLLGGIWGSLDWRWAQYSTKRYYKCC
jgi:4-amino-4-deoxy-L-arabinose transferase-like glycosyltransferase